MYTMYTHLKDLMSYGVLIGPLSCCLSCQFYDIWKWNPRKALRRVTESQIEKLYLPNHKHRNEKRHKITAWSTVWNTLAGTHRWSDGASPIVEQLRWHRYPQWACAPCYFEEHAKSISFFKITLRDRVWPHTRRPFCRQTMLSVGPVLVFKYGERRKHLVDQNLVHKDPLAQKDWQKSDTHTHTHTLDKKWSIVGSVGNWIPCMQNQISPRYQGVLFEVIIGIPKM